MNEARAATAVKHPGIVEIYDFGYHTDGSAYIVMQYLEGETLSARLRRTGTLPAARAAALGRQVAGALGAAQQPPIPSANPTPAAPTATPPAPATPPAAAPTASAAKAPAQVTIKLASEPRGADVYRMPQGVRIGTTPLTYSMDALEGEIVLIVKRRGYVDQPLAVSADRDTDQTGHARPRRAGEATRAGAARFGFRIRVAEQAAARDARSLRQAHIETRKTVMTHWNRSTRTLVLLVIGSLATSAAAQPATASKKQPTQHELTLARAHFQAAEAAKAAHDYKTAATEYLLAHDLFQDPEFFFDVGEVYRLAGNEPDALTYYQKYLELEPGGRGAAASRTAVDELRRSIAAQQAAARRAAEDEVKRKAAEDARRKADQDAARRAAEDEARRKAAEDARRKADQDAARRAAENEARRRQPATTPEVPPTAPAPATWAWYRDPIALGLLGTGVATIGVGTGFLLSAQSADQEAKSAKTYQQVLDAGDRASQRGTRGLIAGGLGIALVGGGVAWIVVHRNSGEQRAITGWLMPGGGGLAAHGRF